MIEISRKYLIEIFLSLLLISNVNTEETDFAPLVSATCKAGSMNIKVLFNNGYSGAIHARDFRNPHCMTFGNGSNVLTMSLNLLAKQGASDYCGILVSNVNEDKTEERSVQLAVRVHRTLELAEDKFYIITCGKPTLPKDDNSQVVLKFFEDDRRVRELAYGREYVLKAEINHQTNDTHLYRGIKVRSCFAFNKKNQSYPLIDDRGCSTDGIVSRFMPSSDGLTATSMIASMFRFPEGAELHIQCSVSLCTEKCPDDEKCVDTKSSFRDEDKSDVILAATTVFVLDPAEISRSAALCDATGIRPHWLLWLAIILGILFLIMLLMNLFLCTAMSCSCARTEVIEKEPSIIEEYDPYRSWHGSQYGSRYSINGNGMKGYNNSGGSTIHSNRTIDSDYAIVHSRPGSSRRM